MASKTLGTVAIIIVCILLFPVGIGIVAAVFGTVFGVIGGVLGAVFGVIGGLIGGIFGIIGNFFEWVFGWGHPGRIPFFHGNGFAIAAVILLIILIARRNSPASPKK